MVLSENILQFVEAFHCEESYAARNIVEIQMSFTNSCASKIELTSCLIFKLHRGSKMSAYALMNLSNELRKR